MKHVNKAAQLLSGPVLACLPAPTPFIVWPPCQRNKQPHAPATEVHNSNSPRFAPKADKAERHSFRNLSFHFCITVHEKKKKELLVYVWELSNHTSVRPG